MYVMLLFALFPASDQDIGPGKKTSRQGVDAVTIGTEALLAKCEKMKLWEYERFVDELGKKRDFASLSVLYNSTRVPQEPAVGVACQIVADEKAVGFCCQFDIDSSNWRSAFCSLGAHPTKAVRDYVKRVANTGDRYRLVLCYDLCEGAGWDDLLEAARRDATDETEMVSLWLNAPIGLKETLGRHARSYIAAIKAKRKD
jgi:hypothetical protein